MIKQYHLISFIYIEINQITVMEIYLYKRSSNYLFNNEYMIALLPIQIVIYFNLEVQLCDSFLIVNVRMLNM